ncbi:MAG: hypothetical protein IKP00_09875 [Victivallales bacterium]|nr:hypothetical protein [Victivallales bacterium]
MTEHVSEATLGRRFWAVNDFSKLTGPNALNPANPDDAAEIKKNNTIAPTILNFVKAGGDTMAQSAVNKAQIFAANHTFTAAELQNETEKTTNNRRELVGGEAEVNSLVNEVATVFLQRNPNVTIEDARRFCKTALDKLMATNEFDMLAKKTLPQNDPNATHRLGEAGLNSLKNAMLGLAGMLKEGTISEKAVLELANGKYYDASNRADLLRLTVDSAVKVKELFIGEARYNALIQQCRDKLREEQNNITPERKKALENQIAQLVHLKGLAVEQRKIAVSGIKTDYSLQDPSGNVKDERKFQKKQLEQVRDSLRAFRYDIDRARGKGMWVMEWMRRKFDDMRSKLNNHRVTTDDYQLIKRYDKDFNDCLKRIRQELFGAQAANQAAHQEDVYDIASAEVGLGDLIDTDASAKAATDLSHLTNDRIRYHYSGAEKSEEVHCKVLSKQLGDIPERGGERTVTLRAGVYALFSLGFIAADLKGKAGGSLEVMAKIKTDNAKGTVSVTYSFGGKGEAGGSAKVGIDPKNKKSEGGLGGKAEGKGSLGLTYSVTKTYANFDELAKNMWELNILMTPRPRELFYSWGKATLKSLGHLFVLGATFTGFRISRSQMDQHAYSATLRNRNIFGNMSGLFLKKRNVELVGERKAVTFNGGLQGKAQGGLYFQNGGELATNISGELSGSIDYSRELSASGKMYTSFAKSLMECSEDHLVNRFNEDAGEMNGAWKDSLVQIVNNGTGNARAITQALAELQGKLTELEDSVLGDVKKNDAFWQDFSNKARLLSIATALLTKRAEALDGAVEGAAAAKAAAKGAVGYIIPRLANPIVKIPSKIYQEKFFNIAEITEPRTSRTVVTGSLTYDALGNFTDGLMEEIGLGDGAKDTIKGDLLNPVAAAGADLAKDSIGLSGTLQFKYTHESVVSKHKDKRPWLNSGKNIFEIRLPASAPIRMAVDLIARYILKHKAGLDKVDESMWLQEFKDGFLDGLKNNVEDVIIEDGTQLLNMTLGQVTEKYPAVGKLLGGINFLKDKRDVDYRFKDASYKTLNFELDSNWRFSSFKVTEDYDTEGKLELTPEEYLSVEFSLSSKTSYDNWKIFTKPKPTTLMKRAADYIAAGNPEGFVNLLMRSKKGVLRLMDAGVTNAPNRPNDKYWEDDKAAMDRTIQQCEGHLNTLAAGDSILAEQAKGLRQTFTDLVASVRNPPDGIEPDERIELAARFFTVCAQIYTLAEMAAHQPPPQPPQPNP